MDKEVIESLLNEVLRASPVFARLSQAEITALANYGRIHDYAAGEVILTADGQDKRMFVLHRGSVLLRLAMWTEEGHCGGEAEFELASPGEAFGWAMWVKPQHITASAQALEKTSVVELDLPRMRESDAFLRLSQRMILELYAHLQEGGLCPANVQALLALRQEAIR